MRDEGVDVVFAQEVPDTEWLDEWISSGYEVALGSGPRYRVRSAVLWRRALPITRLDLPTATYHGSYLAAAELIVRDRESTILVSTHASPNPVREPHLSTWDSLVPVVAPSRPWKRSGGGRYRGEWFDSDFVLGTAAILTGAWGRARARELLMAGDFNECREWDQIEEGAWGETYFANAAQARLVDVTWAAWNEEHATCIANGRRLQLDHVFATPATAHKISQPRIGDLVDEDIEGGHASDHASLTFTLAV